MKTFIITCVTTILCMLGVTSFMEQNKTDEVITAIETQEENAPVYNNYETHNHYEVKEEEEEEPEEMVPSNNSNDDNLYPNLESDDNEGNTFNRATLKCEVCEQSGTELEVWFDSNNVKHYTCKDKCTNGLDALYGK